MEKIKLIFSKGEKEVGLKVTSTKLKNLFLEKFAETSQQLKQAKMMNAVQGKMFAFEATNPDSTDEEKAAYSKSVLLEGIEKGELSYDMFAPYNPSTIEEIQKDDELYVDIFKSIIDDKNFTTNEKSEMANVEFWDNQDLIMIRNTVDSFRQIFNI